MAVVVEEKVGRWLGGGSNGVFPVTSQHSTKLDIDTLSLDEVNTMLCGA